MTSTAVYVFAPYRLLPSQRQLLCADAPVKLGGRAFDVLVALIERRDRTVSKNELMDLVWPKLVVEENNLEVQIVTLRKLLGYAAIATVPGRGYRFTLPVTQESDDRMQVRVDALPATQGVATQRSNLPPGLPVLFGRDEDLHHLLSLLESHGLVTVAGAAGIGKTRLAQAAAAAWAERSTNGVWWVDLSPLSESSLVPNAIAIALSLNLDGAADVGVAVLNTLCDQSPLVVLDNAEHLLGGVAAFVTRLRQAAPGARLLVTSQEPLRIDDECVFRPEPLSLPVGDDPQRIDASSAVALFVARAKAADRRFELRPENRAVVAEICRRLDGIPLAIELAAARVPLLGVEGLLTKLDQRLHVLTMGHRASLPRHQTLRAALEWSHHLLSPLEQAVLRRLSVFAGGFTLEAAQQVAEDEQGIDRWDVLEHLGALVEKSLVVAEGDAIPRYRMLETTRLFALERLIESGETMDARRRHRDHYLAFAEDCARNLLFGETRRHLARLDIERDNLLLALAWAPGADDAGPGLRLASAMHYYWFMRAMPARGAEVTRTALQRPGAEVPSPERCRALVTAGWMSMWAGAHDEAVRDLAEALELARRLSDPQLLCLVLARFADVYFHHNEREASARLATEAVDVGRPLGDCVELGNALLLQAHTHARGAEWRTAQGLYVEALQLRERMNNTSGMVSAHLGLAQLLIDQDCPDAAKSHLNCAVALQPRADSQYEGLYMIGLTAEWAAATGHPEVAVLLDVARTKQFSQAGFKLHSKPRETEYFKRARFALSSDLVEHLASAGRAMSYEQAMQRVRALLNDGSDQL